MQLVGVVNKKIYTPSTHLITEILMVTIIETGLTETTNLNGVKKLAEELAAVVYKKNG